MISPLRQKQLALSCLFLLLLLARPLACVVKYAKTIRHPSDIIDHEKKEHLHLLSSRVQLCSFNGVSDPWRSTVGASMVM